MTIRKHILFDLDGTLTDPAEGITNSVRAAMAAQNFPIPDQKVLEGFIGPPLDEIFNEVCGFTGPQIDQAVEDFRAYFSRQGINENALYPGMDSLLASLRDAGRVLHVATSKPTDFAEIILDNFNIAQYFTIVRGSGLTHVGRPKAEVVAEVLADGGINPADAVMVGDRRHDVIGARACGLPCVGVLFGYGGRAELEAAQADAIADDVAHLGRILAEF
ncbi:HAD-IA family hydrolase [Ruminococcaceae bacterium OttesenSCG-928-D13]|nr:HAD-IA family hydrolase [Ruminococcaceae bacterium OttesenSCG-928-D13]